MKPATVVFKSKPVRVADGLAEALPGAGLASAEDPTARIQAFYNILLDTMKQGQQLGVQGRFDKLGMRW